MCPETGAVSSGSSLLFFYATSVQTVSSGFFTFFVFYKTAVDNSLLSKSGFDDLFIGLTVIYLQVLNRRRGTIDQAQYLVLYVVVGGKTVVLYPSKIALILAWILSAASLEVSKSLGSRIGRPTTM